MTETATNSATDIPCLGDWKTKDNEVDTASAPVFPEEGVVTAIELNKLLPHIAVCIEQLNSPKLLKNEAIVIKFRTPDLS